MSRQSFRAPVHLSKPHLESGALVVQLVNPTAGFFDGDRLDLAVEAGKGSRMVLSTPGASRVHRARGEEAAVCSQHLTVEEDAFLEWIPEPFIPQAGARYHQKTTIALAPGAGLFFFDWISPAETWSPGNAMLSIPVIIVSPRCGTAFLRRTISPRM